MTPTHALLRTHRGRPDTGTLTIGSLFSGYLGLDLAVRAVFPDAREAWVSDVDKCANRILAHRAPGVPNLGDITAIDWSGVQPVDIITGGSPCFPSGTLIDTRDGYRPIEDIRLGDEVLTHRGRYMPVVQLMTREADDTLAVKVMGVPEFVTTTEHPFYVRTKGRVWNNDRRSYDRIWTEPDWVSAGQLTKDHFVGFQLDDRDDSVAELGVDLALLIGRWLGDGWTRTAKRGSRVNSRWHQVYICCAHDEVDELADVIRRAGFKPAVSEVTRTVTKFRINSQALVALLAEFGHGAGGKRVPGWVYRLPKAEQAAIWAGWRDSDGHTAANGAQKVTTVSRELAYGMARIARNAFLLAVSVHHFPMPPTCVIEGRTVNQKDQYQVVLPPLNREAFVEDGWCWAPVRTVAPSAPAKVYNFGVQDDESYTAWGITVHNCQDLSTAGRRAGMTDGTRSNLWVAMRDAIAALQPTYVVWENVRGALSAAAASSLEPCPGCMGGAGYARPSLRALGRVLGDLADLGYDAQWHGLRAADVGACHGRFRVFVLAYAHDAGRVAPAERHGHPVAGAVRPDLTLLPTPITKPTTPRATDGTKGGPNQRGSSGDLMLPSAVALLPTPSVADSMGGHERRGGARGEELLPKGLAKDAGRWSEYASAIARHERAIGRPAPALTEPGPKGNQRLSVRFVEWMMMLPEGWVTDVPGITRIETLRALGNGVVPAQAASALTLCLSRAEAVPTPAPGSNYEWIPA